MKGTFLIVIIFCVLAAGGTGVVSWKNQQAEAKKAVEEWVQGNPVNAMILQDYPDSYPLFYSHFMKYYEDKGAAGLKDGQIEMQQIANVKYLSDYAWYVSDDAVKNYLLREYAFLKALADNDKSKGKEKGRGLCEQYRKNSALFRRARETAGGTFYEDYIRASENLFMSAQAHNLYPVWPGIADYKNYITPATISYVLTLRRLYPDNPELEEAFRSRKSQNCKTLLMLNAAMLQLPLPQASLLWRALTELERTAVPEKKKKGSGKKR